LNASLVKFSILFLFLIGLFNGVEFGVLFAELFLVVLFGVPFGVSLGVPPLDVIFGLLFVDSHIFLVKLSFFISAKSKFY